MRPRTLIVGLGVLVVAVIGVAVFYARQNSQAPITTPPNPGDTKVNPKDGLSYIWIPPGTFPDGLFAGEQ